MAGHVPFSSFVRSLHFLAGLRLQPPSTHLVGLGGHSGDAGQSGFAHVKFPRGKVTTAGEAMLIAMLLSSFPSPV